MEKQLIITPDTKVYELLEVYPQLEDKLIEIAPVFKKLKNPVLKKTIARVTTLRQAAIVGQVPLSEIINKLRKEVNQNEMLIQDQKKTVVKKPEWVKIENVKIEYNAISDLENGIHPVNKVIKELQTLTGDELYVLITNFIPAPLISLVEQKGYQTYFEQCEDGNYRTYIRRSIKS